MSVKTKERRYDVDGLRVIAIGLLIIYHVAICFQPWGGMIGFITAKKFWPELWWPMSMLNVWRIPLLFLLSGMGVYFSMQSRSWSGLLLERTKRILLPFLFGLFVIVPVHLYVRQAYYDSDYVYHADPGHLWFLANIFIYVLLVLPLIYVLKKNENSTRLEGILKRISSPILLLIPAILLVVEVGILQPRPFELYARTNHGFVLGLICFLAGMVIAAGGNTLKNKIVNMRFLWLVPAMLLFLIRMKVIVLYLPDWVVAVESYLWMLTMLSFGGKYLSVKSDRIRYLSEAAYPVYILHMIFLYLGAFLFFDLNINAPLQFVLLVLFTLACCMITYEAIRRVKWLRPLFGLKW